MARKTAEVVKEERAALKRRRFQLVPLEEESIDISDYEALKEALTVAGNTQVLQPAQMLKARNLYCTELLDKHIVAERLSIPINQIDHWIAIFGWNIARENREHRLFEKIANIKRKVVPDIDTKHDLLFHNIESLIEDTIYHYTQSDTLPEPKDIGTLTSAAKTCMESRRLVHKKEGHVSKKVIEFQNSGLVDQFAEMLTGLLGKGQAQISDTVREEIKLITPTKITSEDNLHEQEADDV